jgi:hypothetical protein
MTIFIRWLDLLAKLSILPSLGIFCVGTFLFSLPVMRVGVGLIAACTAAQVVAFAPDWWKGKNQ